MICSDFENTQGKGGLPGFQPCSRTPSKETSAQKKSLLNRKGDGPGIWIKKILELLEASGSCLCFHLPAIILPIMIHTQRPRCQRRGWDVGPQQHPRVQCLQPVSTSMGSFAPSRPFFGSHHFSEVGRHIVDWDVCAVHTEPL